MSSETGSDVVIVPSETVETPKESDDNSEEQQDVDDATETVDRKQTVAEEPSKTGIGREEVGKEGGIVDLAEWEGRLKESAKSLWPLVIFGSGRGEGVSIWNPYLVELIRTQLPFSPDVSFDANSVSIAKPYAALFFHLDTLASFVENDESASDSDRESFKLLQRFYFTMVRDHHDIIQSSLASGNIRFDNLWAAFEPGELLVKEDEFLQPTLYVIGASTFRSGIAGKLNIFDNAGSSNRRFCVDAWNIEWDKSKRNFNRALTTFTINEYEGTRSVSGFEICQIKYHCHGDQSKISSLLQKAEERGREWRDLLSGKPLCRQHDGPATEVSQGIFGISKSAPKRSTHLSERVIVDADIEDSTITELGIDAFADIGRVMSEFTSLLDEGVVQQASLSTAYAHFDAHPPEKPFSSLQAQLAPGIVDVLALSSQTRYRAALSNLSEVNWARESYESLVLEQSKKNLLRSLVDQHYFTKISVGHDFIDGKGKGLAVILHGPPGTGKTLTAESVAEYTRKPLFRVNVGELTMEQNVVPRLQAIFRKASRWDAILLMDEADVVLEQRSYEDLKRNGIVSVFLRMLEYYEGILFLTTNRLGTIDSAFQSRIQLGIPYKPWSSKTRRKVWMNFINRLPESESQAKEDLEDRVDEMAKWDLNGRDIRNVMGLAQSIALTEGERAGSLRFSHIKQVADGIQVFHEAFQQTEQDSRSKMAAVSHPHRAWPGHGSNFEKATGRSSRGKPLMQQDSESDWDD